MASKENQEALENIRNKLIYFQGKKLKLDGTNLFNNIDTLQKAIDELELHKKAFEIATNGKNGNYLRCSTDPNIEPYRRYLLNQARKELENGK